MADSAEKYAASIDGLPLDIETLEDGFEKALVQHEFPFRDGALLEDMGQKARTVRVRCYFWGETYEAHRELLERLERLDLLDFVHPKYGLLHGGIESIVVRHDDRRRTAEIDLTFIENLRGEAQPDARPDVAAEAEQAFVAGIAEQADAVVQDMRDVLGAEADTICGRVLAEGQDMLGQFTGLSAAASDYVRTVDTYVNGFSAALAAVANPANSLTATISYATNLPGRVIGAVARTVERYARLFDSVRSAPTRFVASLTDGVDEMSGALEDAIGGGASGVGGAGSAAKSSMTRRLAAATAQRAALEMAYIYKEDEQIRQAVRRVETAASFDVLGNDVKAETPGAIMTVNELEATLAVVRARLQASLAADRLAVSLKDLAVALLVHVNSVKLERDRIVTVRVDPEIPLHLVCQQYGLPYNYAERIYSLNNIAAPNFTRGHIDIYAGQG